MRRIRDRLLLRSAHLTTVLATAAAGVIVAAPLGPVVAPASAKGPTSFTVVGSGWGHGRGLSQYGAQNAASNLGASAGRILDQYYPGTAAGATGGRLAILLTADTTDSVIVAAAPGLRVRNAKNGRTYALKRTGAKRWRLIASGSRTKVQAKRAGGSFRTVRVVHGQAEFYRTAKRPVTLLLPGGATAEYRGRLRSAYAGSNAARDTVNIVTVEDYLRGVVPSEVPAGWHPEAVKAQAVAARTYAVWFRDVRRLPRHYDLCDTTACQVYRGVAAEKPASDAAVAATRGQVRLFNGAPALTEFASSSGGWTVRSSLPYQVSQADPWDTWAGNPNASWTVTFSDTEIEAKYPSLGDLNDVVVTGDPAAGNRAVSVLLDGAAADVTLGADDFRRAFNLRSTMFRRG